MEVSMFTNQQINKLNQLLIIFFTMILCFGMLTAQNPGWVTCDFHQHTTFTDGSFSYFHVTQKNAQFGLSWWANSEHGGAFNRNGLMSGKDIILGVDSTGKIITRTTYWDTYTYGVPIGNGTSGTNPKMWRWQSLRDFVYLATQLARKIYPDKVIFQSFEWNVPGHEHCSLGLFPEQFQANDNCNALAEFEYRFDAADKDTLGGLSQGWQGKNFVNDHAKALQALEWLQKNFKNKSYAIIAHPERKLPGKGGYTIADFRDFNTVAPDVCFGFESIPGHQKAANRGEYSNTSAGGGTYGGSGIYSAKIGGLWDAMLSEGRHFWLFSNSDFHDTTADFYPGEYQKTYVYVKDTKSPQAIFEGLKSGNVCVVTGDLIDSLYFYIDNTTMGGTANINGDKINVTIRFHEPNKPNNNIWSSYNRQKVDHVDLIAGKIGNLITKTDPLYNVDSVSTTSVIARFDANGGVKDSKGLVSQKWNDLGNGWKKMKMEVTLTSNMYFRLRGTNLGLNVPNETDGAGNPLSDTLAGGYGTNNAVKTFNDLWFYSNPIFVKSSKFTSIIPNNENDYSDKYLITPNPANSYLTISNLDIETKFRIYTIEGNKILEGEIENTNNSINIENLSKGIYFIELINESGIFTHKFVKD